MDGHAGAAPVAARAGRARGGSGGAAPGATEASDAYSALATAAGALPGSAKGAFAARVLTTLQQRARGAEYRPQTRTAEADAMQRLGVQRGMWGTTAAVATFTAVSVAVGRVAGSTAALAAASIASQRASALAEGALAPWALGNLLALTDSYSPLATEAAVIVRELAPKGAEGDDSPAHGFGRAADAVLFERTGAAVAPRVAEAAKDKKAARPSIAKMLAIEREREEEDERRAASAQAARAGKPSRQDDMTLALRGGRAVAAARRAAEASAAANAGAGEDGDAFGYDRQQQLQLQGATATEGEGGNTFFDSVLGPGFWGERGVEGGGGGSEADGDADMTRRTRHARERAERRARIAAIRARREAEGFHPDHTAPHVRFIG